MKHSRNLTAAWCLAGALAFLAGCGDGNGPGRTVASITVTPSTPTIALGESQQFAATARDADGNVIDGKSFTWESSAVGIATVNNAGKATAVAAGITTISATADGIAGTASLTVSGAIPGVQTLTAVGGRLQRGPASADLPVAYVVEARDGSTPLPGVDVFWSVIDGGGAVSQASSVTGADGRASIVHTLGSAPGVQQVMMDIDLYRACVGAGAAK